MKGAAQLVLALCFAAACAPRSLQDAAHTPAPAQAGMHALLAIVSPSGLVTGMVPVSDGTDLQVTMSGVSVVTPGGAIQASLHLEDGNSTLQILAAQDGSGYLTVTNMQGASIKVPLAPAQGNAPAPGMMPTGIQSQLSAMPGFVTYFKGTFDSSAGSTSVDVYKGGGSVKVSYPKFSGDFTWHYG